MSGKAFVVLPVSADGAQHAGQDTAEIASAIQQSLHEKTHPEEYKEPEQTGPLKQIMAHQDSLYKYISWEDPIRTLGSYIGALSILFGVHYLPLTQLAMKAGVTTLGVVSVTEFASRSFGTNSLSTRIRPKEYKQVPEPTLNATLKDIHDLIQYVVVQAQRIVFGQDLDKTFAAFLGFTALYWLIKIVSPFWLAVMGLTSLYIAPLVASPRGRAVARDASARAQDMANAAAENGRGLAQNGKVKAAELSSKARQATLDTQGHIQNIAQNGKQTAADVAARASGTASDTFGSAAENVRKLPQMGTNAINRAPGTANSVLGDGKQYINSSLSTGTNGNSDGNRSVAGGTPNRVSQISNSAAESARQMESRDRVANQFASDHLDSAVSSLPGQTGGVKTGSVADSVSIYTSAGDADATHGIMDRPRGSALPTLDGAY